MTRAHVLLAEKPRCAVVVVVVVVVVVSALYRSCWYFLIASAVLASQTIGETQDHSALSRMSAVSSLYAYTAVLRPLNIALTRYPQPTVYRDFPAGTMRNAAGGLIEVLAVRFLPSHCAHSGRLWWHQLDSSLLGGKDKARRQQFL